jgi:hypothetical protein
VRRQEPLLRRLLHERLLLSQQNHKHTT